MKPALLWSLRLLFAALFLHSGLVKLTDLHTFAQNTANYRLLTDRQVILTALHLPWLEIWTATTLLLIPPFRRAAWLSTLLMLLVFTAAKASALARGLDITCGCGTGTDPMTLTDLLENLLLLALATAALLLERIPKPAT